MVYVIASHAEEQASLFSLCTRQHRTDVENELSKLLGKRGNRRRSSSPTPQRVSVNSLRQGVLVFEVAEEAERYAELLAAEGMAKDLIAASATAFDVRALSFKSGLFSSIDVFVQFSTAGFLANCTRQSNCGAVQRGFSVSPNAIQASSRTSCSRPFV